MTSRRIANLDRPDERIEFNGAVEELVTLGDVTVGRDTQAVGWRWSKDWQPTIGGDSCEAHHIGVMISGRQGERSGPRDLGDGVLATFDGPAQAIRAALAIGRAAKTDGLLVRAGIHVGEVELAGDRVRGIAVHQAARVLALAGPGDVLVSESTRALLSSMRIVFEDRGSHILKGIPGEHRVFAVGRDSEVAARS
jgi:hypothetical protein